MTLTFITAIFNLLHLLKYNICALFTTHIKFCWLFCSNAMLPCTNNFINVNRMTGKTQTPVECNSIMLCSTCVLTLLQALALTKTLSYPRRWWTSAKNSCKHPETLATSFNNCSTCQMCCKARICSQGIHEVLKLRGVSLQGESGLKTACREGEMRRRYCVRWK